MWLFIKSILRHTLNTKYKTIFSEIHLKTLESIKSSNEQKIQQKNQNY